MSQEDRKNNTWTGPGSYRVPVLAAVILHLVLGTLLWAEWPESDHRVVAPVPEHIRVDIVQVENKAAKARKEAELKKKKRQERRKKAAEKRRKERAKKKAEAEKRKKAEQKALALKKKKEAERKAREKEKKQQEAEKKRKEEQKRLIQDELSDALAAEEELIEEKEEQKRQAQSSEDQRVIDDHSVLIRQKISDAWTYPSGSRPDMEVVVSIRLVPTGEVVDANIVVSSGSDALDRSVLAAIKRAQPLPVPEDSRLFEREFRRLEMKFRPENAVY